MSSRTGHRISAAAVFVGCLAYGLEAHSFETGFIADPIGPKAFPYVLAALGAALSGVVFLRSGGESYAWPERHARWRLFILLTSIVLYAKSLALLGFPLATTIELTVLTRLFRGPLRRGFIAAFLFSIGLYWIFAHLLEIRLPSGRLFFPGS